MSKKSFYSRIFGFVFLFSLTAGYVHAEQPPQDVEDFKSVPSKCLKEDSEHIITSDRYFDKDHHIEITADTRLVKEEGNSTQVIDPTIRIYDQHCNLLWSKIYKKYGEIGFEPIDFSNARLLHVAAITIFQPGDNVLVENDILLVDDHGVEEKLSYDESKTAQAYIGSFQKYPNSIIVRRIADPLWYRTIDTFGNENALIFQWRRFRYPYPEKSYGEFFFSGPSIINHRSIMKLALPKSIPHPPFPLIKFIYNFDDPYIRYVQ